MVEQFQLQVVGVTWISTVYDVEYYAYNVIAVLGQPQSSVCGRFDDIEHQADNSPICDVNKDACSEENRDTDEGLRNCLDTIKLGKIVCAANMSRYKSRKITLATASGYVYHV